MDVVEVMEVVAALWDEKVAPLTEDGSLWNGPPSVLSDWGA